MSFRSLAVLLLVCTLIVADNNAKWKIVEAQGGPSQRGAARMEAVDGHLILFGGFDECFDINAGCDHVWFNEVWSFDLDDEEWTQASPTSNVGTLPGARAFLGSAKYELKDSIIYFGGVRYNIAFNEITFFGDMWEYFPDDDHFVRRTQLGAVGPSGQVGPGKRAGTALAISGHTLYAVAGIDDQGSFTYRNDVWKYNLRTNVWTILFADRSGNAATTPAVRYLASVVYHEQGNLNELVVYGGNAEPTGSGQQNQDTWRFNLDNAQWTKVNSIPGNTVGRTHGAFALDGHKFIIALGDLNDNTNECPTNEVSGGQLATNGTWVLKLNRNNPQYCKEQVKSPPKLKRVAFAQKNNKLFIWGGFDFNCQTSTALWNTEIYSLKLSNLNDC